MYMYTDESREEGSAIVAIHIVRFVSYAVLL